MDVRSPLPLHATASLSPVVVNSLLPSVRLTLMSLRACVM